MIPLKKISLNYFLVFPPKKTTNLQNFATKDKTKYCWLKGGAMGGAYFNYLMSKYHQIVFLSFYKGKMYCYIIRKIYK